MSDEVDLDGSKYISSKRASEMSGYSQDYLGQLARAGAIDARRVGGLWYVSIQSVNAHKDGIKILPPQATERSEADSFVALDGKSYISSSRASKVSGYSNDYIGQLAREGKIMSHQVGNRWYVDQESLLEHKREKDALLGGVQVASVQLYKAEPSDRSTQQEYETMNYFSDSRELLPSIETRPSDAFGDTKNSKQNIDSSRPVPIRVVADKPDTVRGSWEGIRDEPIRSTGVSAALVLRKPTVPGPWIGRSLLVGAALTVVVVLTLGYSSLRSQSSYVLTSGSQQALVGSLVVVLERIGGWLEHFLTKELSYTRP